MSDRDSTATANADTTTSRLLVVGLFVLALLVAAFAIPVTEPAAGDAGGPGPSLEFPLDLSWLFDRDGGDPPRVTWDLPDEPGDGIVVIDGEGALHVTDEEHDERFQECAVLVPEEPTPGGETVVYVWNEGSAVPDVPVYFNGDLQGRTDENGRAVGTVDYSGELTIEVSVPGAQTCLFVVEDAVVSEGDSVDAESRPASVTVGNSPASATAGTVLGARLAQTGFAENHSTELSVEGDVSIVVRDDPYPGEAVETRVRIEGEPVPGATVRVDGADAVRTDETGRATVTLPDDGREVVSIVAERGEFSGSSTVQLLVLDVTVHPHTPLPVPGDGADVAVRMGDRPVPNATVQQDGTVIGTTGPNGTVGLTLPVEPRTTVSTAVRDQTASTALWPVYLPTAAAVLLVLVAFVGSLTAAGIVGGTRGVLGVGLAWGGGLVLAVAAVLYGRRGVAVVAGTLVAVVLVVAGLTHREQTTAGARETGRGLRNAVVGLWRRLRTVLGGHDPVEWVRRKLVALSSWLGVVGVAVTARLRRVGDRLRQHPRPLLVVLTQVPRRLLAALGGSLAWARARLRRTGPTVRVLGVGLVVVLAGAALAYWQFGPLVATVAGVTLAVALAVLVVVVYRHSVDGEPAAGASPSQQGHPTNAMETRSRVTLRRLWRTVARWVVPNRWQSRTPGEITRLAVEKGYPEEPVEQLADVFRDVEYGGRPLTGERWETARAAFRRLATEREEKR